MFVHGLNPLNERDYAKETWTASNGVFWPLDLLPQDFPNARIILFAYNSNVTVNTSLTGLAGHAGSLIEQLSLDRAERNVNSQILPSPFQR